MNKLSGESVKKIIGIAGVVVAGVSAVFGALNDQKKEREFEDLKKVVAELKGKES